LGARLAALREARGLKQQQVGDKAGFTAKYVSEIERGRRDVPLSTLRMVVERGLGATLEEALQGVSPRKAKAAGEMTARQPLPPGVEETAQEIAALPEEQRRKVIGLVRGVLDLVR
jgi:transcriptional regulator with XRE-family HTH domain